ncbi:hypothetical protein M758_2G205700 [Ceratodon purpureus]|nr:hypothetical protein M758_2G205700 [Ceratodon purpureus]
MRRPYRNDVYTDQEIAPESTMAFNASTMNHETNTHTQTHTHHTHSLISNIFYSSHQASASAPTVHCKGHLFCNTIVAIAIAIAMGDHELKALLEAVTKLQPLLADPSHFSQLTLGEVFYFLRENLPVARFLGYGFRLAFGFGGIGELGFYRFVFWESFMFERNFDLYWKFSGLGFGCS